MPMRCQSDSKRQIRSNAGAQVVEFGAALCILVGFIVIPMIDLVVVPIRWMLAQQIVNDYSRNLAVSETFSDALRRVQADPSLQTRLERLGGVYVKALRLQMRIGRTQDSGKEQIIREEPRQIPVSWLPDGANAPCSYSLDVLVDAEIAPAIIFKLGNASVPGLTKPIPIAIRGNHVWGNLGRNPRSGNYYLNE